LRGRGESKGTMTFSEDLCGAMDSKESGKNVRLGGTKNRERSPNNQHQKGPLKKGVFSQLGKAFRGARTKMGEEIRGEKLKGTKAIKGERKMRDEGWEKMKKRGRRRKKDSPSVAQARLTSPPPRVDERRGAQSPLSEGGVPKRLGAASATKTLKPFPLGGKKEESISMNILLRGGKKDSKKRKGR